MDHATAAAAAAEALGMTDVAEGFDALYSELRSARDARDDDRRALHRAQAHLRVTDAQWDRAVVDISGVAYTQAGKDAKAEPYHSLFGTMPARDVVDLGPEKATALGDKLLEKVKAHGDPTLDRLATVLAEVQQRLRSKDEMRDAAEVKLAGRSVERVKWVQQLQHAVNLAEVELLKAHPGRKDLVRAVLAPPSAPARKPRDEDDGTDEGGEDVVE